MICIPILNHWLCNLEIAQPQYMIWSTTQPQYMIWLSSETVFWCEFNGDGDYVILGQHSHNTWYGYHLKPFFNMNSMMMYTTNCISIIRPQWCTGYVVSCLDARSKVTYGPLVLVKGSIPASDTFYLFFTKFSLI